nr:hypothetical protein [Synechococcus sp. AH-551-C10]
MREPTAGVKYQNEPIQAPLNQVEKSASFDDVGREDARRIRESNNPNTRYVDKPPSTPSKNALLSSQSRQQAMMRDAQHQVLGESALPKLTPSGRYTAPPVNTKGSIVFKGGVAHYQAPLRSNLVTAVAGVAGQMLVQPLADAISDNVINPLMGAALDRDIPKMEEIRRLEALQIQNNEEVAANDVRNAAIRQQRLEDAREPFKEGEAPDASMLPPMASEVIAQQARAIPITHSQSSNEVDRNREYKIRRAALGDHPTQEEMDTVVAYGLEQHRINFPHLYK